MANLLYQSLQTGLEEDMFTPDAAFAAAAAVGLNSADDSLPYSTSELNAPEYSTDDFRMFQFKVARCSKRYVHDWRACPFAHPTENARRRDPRLVKYLPVPCPDYKRGICLRGDACTYSHGVYECWLHPAKYRTQLCKEGPNCRRPVCFFAHSVLDLRQPSHMFDPTAEEVAGGVTGPPQPHPQQSPHVAAGLSAAAHSRISSDTAFGRLSSEEIMNNIQGQEGPSRSPSLEVMSAAPAVGPTVAALLATAVSPASRQSSASLTRSSSENRPIGSAPGSPDRSGSPNAPAGTHAANGSSAPTPRLVAQSIAPAPVPVPASDAATAMAVLTQQQQAQAQAAAAQAAAAIARLSIDGRGSLDAASSAAAAAATTKAMLQANAAAALPPRMSLDSLLATRQGSGWVPAAPPAPTAAAALAGASSLPLNEQPFPMGNAPRMSNAVARKLGLAPQRTSLDARLTKLRSGSGAAARASVDGILHALHHNSARSSLDQQQAMMLQAMNPQLGAMAGMGGAGHVPHMGPQVNGYAGPGPYGPGAGHNDYGMPPRGSSDGMALHPALLSLVAAQMTPQQMANGMPMPAPNGIPNGMHSGLGGQHGADPGVAALMDSINGWQMNGGHHHGAPHPMMHRPSMDGMARMGSQGSMPGTPVGGYYEGKGIWGGQEAINNQAGTES